MRPVYRPGSRCVRFSGRGLFLLLTVAILAAAVGDPLVEAIARTGLLGGGYHDTNQRSVLPMLIAGLAMAAVAGISQALDAWRRPRGDARSSGLVDLAREFGTRSIPRDLAIVLPAQFATLFAMESAERILTAGTPPLQALAWLGGPPPFALAMHVALAVVAIVAVRRTMRAFVATFVSFFHAALRFLLVDDLDAVRRADRTNAPFFANLLEPALERIRGRAPPFSHATA